MGTLFAWKPTRKPQNPTRKPTREPEKKPTGPPLAPIPEDPEVPAGHPEEVLRSSPEALGHGATTRAPLRLRTEATEAGGFAVSGGNLQKTESLHPHCW